MQYSATDTKIPDHLSDFEARTHAIIQQEKDYYLQARRAANGLPPLTDDNLVGMCISGGGVRSATLGLGMLQAFIKAGRLKSIDYLSTVSGGGFIGSCLSSLLSKESDWVDKKQSIPNDNKRFAASDQGLEAIDSPFITKESDYEYQEASISRLTAKQQLYHLRQHGAYLTPRRGLFSWDVRRAIGALSGGMVVNFTIYGLLIGFAVLLHHFLLGWLSKDQFIEQIRVFADSTGSKSLLLIRASYWGTALEILRSETILCIQFLMFGAFAGLVLLLWLRRFPVMIATKLADERGFNGLGEGAIYARPGGVSLEQQLTKSCRSVMGIMAYFVGPALSFLVIGIRMNLIGMVGNAYFIFLLLPFFFNLGMFAMVHFMVTFHFINRGKEQVSGRFYRDFFYVLQGSVLIGLLLTALFPIGITLLFSQSGILSRLFGAALLVVVVLKIITTFISRWSYFRLILKNIHGLLLNWSVVIFIALSFALLSGLLYHVEGYLVPWFFDFRYEASFALLVMTGLLLVIIGFFANNNDISLHYFFRDRLSEAYLRTNGKVADKGNGEGYTVAGKDLRAVNLRNHDNLLLKDLGEGNGRGPYHLLVAALNLQASGDLGRRAQRSDHFIFSKFYVGSRTTGYYRTDRYNGGQTRLSTAMTVSAAAVSGGMGLFGFAASHFYMTLFNLRTGYWMFNPSFLRLRNDHEQRFREVKQRLAEKNVALKKRLFIWGSFFKAAISRRSQRIHFWLGYLGAEFMGRLTAEKKMVYVSDGGHTGDNLGLIPLIQRKCRLIYIADFEEDDRYSFSSFNLAVKQAQSVYNANIEIDLRPLIPEPGKRNRPGASVRSVVQGEIEYGDGSKGQIIYMKSSMSYKEDDPEGYSKKLPVVVLNYFQNNPLFPHQPTADQYFNEVQFEAHRLLGVYIGDQALRLKASE